MRPKAKSSKRKAPLWWGEVKRWTMRVIIMLVGLPVFYTLYLRYMPVPTTPLMVMRGIEGFNEKGYKERCYWRSYAYFSPSIKKAVVAAEDQRFAHHFGFDTKAIQGAIKRNKKGGNLRGGSTISQQVAKNLFLWPGGSYIRKGVEVYFTFLIEILWPKERILQVYLNIAEMGDGVFGAESAARRYWNKGANDLNTSEGALIAAVLPNPRIYHVNNPSAYTRKRQAQIKRAMRYIGEEEVPGQQ